MLDELEHKNTDVEPMMAGSDDEFEDFEDVYLEDVQDDDDGSNVLLHTTSQSPSDAPNSSSNSSPFWSSTLKPVTIPTSGSYS